MAQFSHCGAQRGGLQQLLGVAFNKYWVWDLIGVTPNKVAAPNDHEVAAITQLGSCAGSPQGQA